MSGYKIDVFQGLIPKAPATLLPERAATIANNCDLAYGELRSTKIDSLLKTLTLNAQSVWSDDGLLFFAWPEDIDAIVSPLQAGQANDRLYYASDTDFRVTLKSSATIAGGMPVLSYRVGVPRPTVAPIVTVTNPVAPADGTGERTIETRAYTYTYANAYNEEGPPSPATVVQVITQTHLGVTTTGSVIVGATFDVGNEVFVPITGARIYHTANGGSIVDYFYAMTIDGSTGTISKPDTIAANEMNEMLVSLDSYPPDVLLKGLFDAGNGIMAAWKGRELWFSDPFRPWSWPPKYMLTFKHPVISAISNGTGALVTTMGGPVMVSGVSPDAMTAIALASPQAGVSKWAILDLDGEIAYASHDGIVIVNGGAVSMKASDRFFTRATWRARCNNAMSTIEFAYYDGKLVVFSKTNAFVAFMIGMDEAGGLMSDLPDLIAKTSLVLVTSDQMYTVNGTALNQFGGGADAALVWKSGTIILPSPQSFGIAQADCAGTFTIKFYADDVLGYTITVNAGVTTFRLPAQAIPGHAGLPLADRWSFEIAGAGTFRSLKAAPSGKSLAEV